MKTLPDMMPQYEFRLNPMSGARSRAGAPGEMIPCCRLPASDTEDGDILFVFRNGVVSFEEPTNEDKNLKPSGTLGCFCESPYHVATFVTSKLTVLVSHGSTLMLEPYANNVFVEMPPSNDLPRFDRINVPSCKAVPKLRRHIYLRPGDTVHFEDHQCAILISAGKVDHSNITSFAESDKITTSPEIQVKSSAHQPTTGPGAATMEDKDTEDEDDLDGLINTPLNVEDTTPATSRLTDTLAAVKETPTRPARRESNHVFSTAPDKIASPNFNGDSNRLDGSIPAARAGAGRRKKATANQSEDVDSQFVFQTSKGLTTYGNTPKAKAQARREVQESPSKSEATIEVAPAPRRSSNRMKVDENTAVTMSSPKRKRSLADTDEEEDMAPPASTLPATKRARGRPAKESKVVKTPQTKSGKPRGRPSNVSNAKEEDEATEPPSSSGKLKRVGRKSAAKPETDEEDDKEEVSTNAPRRKANLSPDLDLRASSTPLSSATPQSGKAPTKTLLSNSSFAEDKNAAIWLQKHGAPIEDKKIPGKRSNFVCVVGTGELPTTAKVVRSVALGKKVVTDEWLKHSMAQDKLLDLDGYIHDDLVGTMTINRTKLFEGKALFITSALEKTYGQKFADVKELATAVGSHRVDSGTAKKATGLGLSDSATIFLAVDGDDPDAQKLVQEGGRTVYQKDLLTQSILRGELLTDSDEFKWNPKAIKGKKGKK
jgi:hypothetical protein